MLWCCDTYMHPLLSCSPTRATWGEWQVWRERCEAGLIALHHLGLYQNRTCSMSFPHFIASSNILGEAELGAGERPRNYGCPVTAYWAFEGQRPGFYTDLVLRPHQAFQKISVFLSERSSQWWIPKPQLWHPPLRFGSQHWIPKPPLLLLSGLSQLLLASRGQTFPKAPVTQSAVSAPAQHKTRPSAGTSTGHHLMKGASVQTHMGHVCPSRPSPPLFLLLSFRAPLACPHCVSRSCNP